jgi:replicative DNA helicase
MSSSSSPEVKKSYIGKKHVNLENEQKLLSYFFRYPEEAMLFSENDFVDPVSRNIFSGISALQEQNLSFDLDTLKTLFMQCNRNRQNWSNNKICEEG